MKNNFDKPKYVIVLGTTYSGSHAVFDYLNGRGDLHDPLVGNEYLLPILPNGLMALESASEKAFDPATTEYALTQFKSIAYKLMDYWSTASKDKKLNEKILTYKDEIEKFIFEISSADYPMKILWREELLLTPIERFLEKIKNRLGIKKKILQTRLLVSQKNLVIAAQKMHDKMFQLNTDRKPILLVQSGSGWNPIESTKYFSNCKIVIVTRDPRDQFVFIKNEKKGTSVEGFIDWYKEMQRRLKLINDSKVLFIKFEDFVQKNLKSTELICNHFSLPHENSSTYQPEKSKKNIGKFKKLITQTELQIIESKLGEYIYASK